MSMALKHFQLRELLQEQGVLFCYSGYVNEGILSGIGQAIKQKLTLENANVTTIRDIFSIFVEQMQNIIRYSAEREPETAPSESVLSYGTLTVGRCDAGFYVACSNKIAWDDVERMQSKLSAIREMDRSSLNKLYRQILKGDIPEGSKGAGAGFVHIARIATQPIEFDFFNLDDQYSFFSFKAII
ncbi:MAG: hypothetical protein HQL73_06630 [Magnetococcales bacterium]|nr:hypothetical protein [Magnetococcales bacterium]